MPYLLSKNNTSNLLIDKTGESIYYRRYPIKYNQRAVVIAKSTNNEYAASLDEYSNIHMIYKNSSNGLVHLFEKNSKFEATNLLDDYENKYQISNIKYLYKQKNYIFYCAYNPYEQTSDLIFHSFKDNEKTEPQSLFSVPTLSCPYECILNKKIIYLLCQILNDQGNYELNLYKYNTSSLQWEEFENVVDSTSPFIDYSLCFHEGKICITYVKRDMNNNIYYISKSNTWDKPVKIYSTNELISPIIFLYNNIIWINFKENNKLKYSLSCDNGNTFTEPKLCSAQNPEARHFYFYGYREGNLYGNKFFGYIYKYPILAVLSQVDTDNILLSSQTNLEIKSIIGNFTSNEMYNMTLLKKELEEQKEVQKNITIQYDNLAKMAKELQNQAKMWKSKTTQAEHEIKKLKKKLRKTYIASTNNDMRENKPLEQNKKIISSNTTIKKDDLDISASNPDISNLIQQIEEKETLNKENIINNVSTPLANSNIEKNISKEDKQENHEETL